MRHSRPNWSRAFSPQAEIHDYIRRTAHEFGILPHIVFHAEVTEATWLETQQRWQVVTPAGTVHASYAYACACAAEPPPPYPRRQSKS